VAYAFKTRVDAPVRHERIRTEPIQTRVAMRINVLEMTPRVSVDSPREKVSWRIDHKKHHAL